eukprot:gene25676-31400_t
MSSQISFWNNAEAWIVNRVALGLEVEIRDVEGILAARSDYSEILSRFTNEKASVPSLFWFKAPKSEDSREKKGDNIVLCTNGYETSAVGCVFYIVRQSDSEGVLTINNIANEVICGTVDTRNECLVELELLLHQLYQPLVSACAAETDLGADLGSKASFSSVSVS